MNMNNESYVSFFEKDGQGWLDSVKKKTYVLCSKFKRPHF